MKVLLLDIYRNVNYRISKDTSGGYGTGNNFGNSFFTNYLKKKFKKEHDWPPLFLAYTHAVLKRNGHEVTYSKKLLSDYNSYDIYIISSSIVCCETEIEVIKKIKNSTNKPIFSIGPFATSNPNKYIDAGSIVISGEPEFYFLKNKNIEIDFNNKNIINFEHSFSLDDLPMPNWEELIENFKKVSNLFGRYKNVPIIGTRGCPYSCFKYCVYPLQQGRKVRQRTPKSIVEEMEYWTNRGIKMFTFRDPVFSINRKHTLEFCEEIEKKKLKCFFIIETHLRILDTELINKLKKAGLKAVKVGVESVDEEVLKNANRFTVSKDQQISKIRELENNNIQVSAMFIIGFPNDNINTINATIEYAKKINSTYSQFSVWTPYPGTPVFEEYKDKITTDKYEHFDQYRLVYKHDKFNGSQIRKLLTKCYNKYYLRFSWMLKYIKSFST